MIEWNINGSPPAGENPVTYPENLQLRTGDMLVWNGSAWTPTEVILEGWQNIHAGNITSGFINNARLSIDASRITSGTIDYARLPDLNLQSSAGVIIPMITSVAPEYITRSTSQNLTITGLNFTPNTILNMPGCTISNYQVLSPTKITCTISKSTALTGASVIITVSNGAVNNTNWSDGIKSLLLTSDDIYWNNVVLFVRGDGADNSTNIIDSSSTPKILTRMGDTKISVSQIKYGNSSIYFDGTGDNLTLPSPHTDLNLTADFTIEGFLYATNIANRGIFSFDTGSGLYIDTKLILWKDGIGNIFSSNTTNFPANQWTHFAVSRSGTTTRLFQGGILISSGTLSGGVDLQGKSIGFRNFSNNFIGYIDAFRITKGIARYSNNFNPEMDTFLN